MDRWRRASAWAAAHVADRTALWLPGALAWTVSVGWVALLVGVARPATDAELTFLAATVYTAGLWPWNAAAIVVAGLLVAGVAIGLHAVAEAALLHGPRVQLADVRSIFFIGLVSAVPLLAATMAFGVALFPIAPGQFNDPGSDGSALARTLTALGPFVVLMAVAAVLGTTLHAAAIRTVRNADGAREALGRAPAALADAGAAAIAQVVATLVARVAYLLLAAILLRVLWSPIDVRLGQDGFGLMSILLLLGFVAIWLCLVLAGGALHAWGSVSWTRILGERGREAGAVAHMESRSRP
jgi:hypothetical protein